MGIIASFINSLQQNEVRSRVRRLYKSLNASVTNLEKKDTDKKLASEYFKLALKNRSHWKELNNLIFVYSRYGETADIEIQTDEPPMEIIKKIATAEIRVAGKGLSDEQKNKFISLGLEELDKIAPTATA